MTDDISKVWQKEYPINEAATADEDMLWTYDDEQNLMLMIAGPEVWT